MPNAPKRVVLSAAEVDNLRRIIQQGRTSEARALTIAEVTLDGAVELACAWWAWRADAPADLRSLLTEWSQCHELLRRAQAAIQNGHEDDVGTFTAPTAEVRAAPRNTAAISSTTWSTYFARFTRSVITNGAFEKDFAYGVTKAFQEMVDNVVQHSGAASSSAAPGVVGYQVRHGELIYAVGDCGRGVLESLRTNPLWRQLPTARAALDAAVCQCATRRHNEKGGTGFSQVHTSLADMNGQLRFRSGDAVLILDGRGNARRARRSLSPPLAGFQLSVSCAHGGR